MDFEKSGSLPSHKGPAENFTSAAPTTAMTHIAIVEQLEGKTSDWMEKVSDEPYQA